MDFEAGDSSMNRGDQTPSVENGLEKRAKYSNHAIWSPVLDSATRPGAAGDWRFRSANNFRTNGDNRCAAPMPGDDKHRKYGRNVRYTNGDDANHDGRANNVRGRDDRWSRSDDVPNPSRNRAKSRPRSRRRKSKRDPNNNSSAKHRRYQDRNWGCKSRQVAQE